MQILLFLSLLSQVAIADLSEVNLGVKVGPSNGFFKTSLHLAGINGAPDKDMPCATNGSMLNLYFKIMLKSNRC